MGQVGFQGWFEVRRRSGRRPEWHFQEFVAVHQQGTVGCCRDLLQ